MNDIPKRAEPLSLEAILDRFEEAWQRGESPGLDEFLVSDSQTLPPEVDLRELLVELVKIDLERRWSGPEQIEKLRLENYVAQYPELGALEALPAELIAVEYRARRRAGDAPGQEEYLERFGHRSAELKDALERVDHELAGASHENPENAGPQQNGLHVRCPHCNNPIEIVEEENDLCEILCPSCGSSFSLLGDQTSTLVTGGPQKIAHFELINQLGAGAFGTVWMARDTELDRMVAIKVPRMGQLSPEEAEMFLREARAAAQLKHPNIVSVHEVGRADESVYIVSDFVRGVNLSDWLTGQQLTSREAAQLIVKIAEALHHAHEAGVIHRDLKPGNVMIDSEGEPHIMDFGLAKREAGEITMTVEGKVLGTPAYMSPEQARGEGHHVDRRTDVYSLGVMLFELLSGELPFRGSPRMLIYQVVHEEPPAPRKLNNQIPLDLDTICTKALSKEPGRRYETAQELAEDLTRYLGGEPIHARPVGRIERTWRWAKRQPVVAGLSAAVVLSLLTGTAISSYFAIVATRERNEAVIERSRSERLRYVSDMKLAQAYWNEPNVDSVILLLEAHVPSGNAEDLRGWEWFYQWKLCHSELRTLSGHSSAVSSVAFSPDGTRIVSAGGDIKLWDADSGEELLTLKGHSGTVSSVAFSPNGRRLASGSNDNTVRIWDADSGLELRTLKGHSDWVEHVAFSPDGKRLASAGSDRTVKLWDACNGQELRELKGHVGGVASVSFSPDGRRVASASEDWTVKLWDAESGHELRTLKGHSNYVASVSFSPDGTRLASASADGTVKLWDTDAGQELRTFKGHRGFVDGVAFSPDGTFLASEGWDQTVKLWDVDSGQEVRAFKGHRGIVLSVAFSPDGSRLASASVDKTVKLWDADRGIELRTLKGHNANFDQGHNSNVSTVAFGPDGARLASAGDDRTVRLWDVDSGQALRTLEGHSGYVESVAFSPDGSRLASGSVDQTVKLWDADSGQELRTLKGHYDGVSTVAFSSDGRRLASASRDQKIKLWDADSGRELRTLVGHNGIVTSVAFSPDGTCLASSGIDQTVKLWDAERGEVLHTCEGHASIVTSVAFSPDGRRLASGSRDKTVKLWDANTGLELRNFTGYGVSIKSVAFSPDSKRLALSCSNAAVGSIKLCDAEDGLELLTLDGHSSYVYSVAFSPDGMRLASGSEDATVKIWDATLLTPDEKMARFLVDQMFEQHDSSEDVIEAIEHRDNWNDAMREAALAYVATTRDVR